MTAQRRSIGAPLIRTIGLKLVHLVPVLFLVSLVTFLMIDMVPGDPAVSIAGPDASAQQLASIREELNLDQPLVQRYVTWLGQTLTGDLGKSSTPPVQEVSDMIRSRLPVTIEIAVVAMLMSLLIAVPLALRAAHRPNDRFDRTVNAGAFASISIPSFLGALLLIFFFVFHSDVVRALALAILAILLFAFVLRTAADVRLHPSGAERSRYLMIRGAVFAVGIGIGVVFLTSFPSFPRQGFVRLGTEEGLVENFRHVFLPALTLALIEGAIFMRLLRGDLLDTLGEDYILAARAKGMPTWRILTRDALRPSSFSLITVAGVAFGRLIGGTVIVETIFNLPGMGSMIVNAISAHDYRVVQASVLLIAVFYVLINTLVDLSYAYLDPRVRRD